MNLLRVIEIATIGWRSAVPPTERLELLDQVEVWVAEQRRLAIAQQHSAAGRPGPGVHKVWSEPSR
jgi:hypothetical protein